MIKTTLKNLILALAIALASISTFADTQTHWQYEGKAGPTNWGDLSSEFLTCSSGKFQSPIDIRTTIQAGLAPLQLDFHTKAESLVNDGHTLQVIVKDEDDFKLDNEIFILRQYHFHAPSENRINGKAFPLEAHFVHASASGEVAVIAVMFELGDENKALEHLLSILPTHINKVVSLGEKTDLSALFPADRHYYRYSGSLTTPPCTEGLRWLVMKETVTLSANQLAKIKNALANANNRPIQPINGRLIVE